MNYAADRLSFGKNTDSESRASTNCLAKVSWLDAPKNLPGRFWHFIEMLIIIEVFIFELFILSGIHCDEAFRFI